jgi:hypothetical protein
MKKKGMIAINELAAIILALLVIASVAGIYYQTDILRYIKNLPSYQSPNEELDISNLSHEQLDSICPITLGKIKDDYFFICEEGDRRCLTSEATKLWIKGTESSAKIYVDKNWAVDSQIAGVSERKISVNQEVLLGSGALYNKVKSDLPKQEFLMKLNEAYLVGNFICRMSALKQMWVGGMIDTNNPPKNWVKINEGVFVDQYSNTIYLGEKIKELELLYPNCVTWDEEAKFPIPNLLIFTITNNELFAGDLKQGVLDIRDNNVADILTSSKKERIGIISPSGKITLDDKFNVPIYQRMKENCIFNFKTQQIINHPTEKTFLPNEISKILSPNQDTKTNRKEELNFVWADV